jgi:hypothetical protein
LCHKATFDKRCQGSLSAGVTTKRQILHTAQSQYHDIGPARSLGQATAWIEGRRGRQDAGATPVAKTHPARLPLCQPGQDGGGTPGDQSRVGMPQTSNVAPATWRNFCCRRALNSG